MSDEKKLYRANRFILKKYKKATDKQKEEMKTILKEQLDNLQLLYDMM